MTTTEIELVGGQLDGRTMLLSPGRDGLPIAAVVIPVAVPSNREDISDPVDIMESATFTQLRYERTEFAETRHRWLYRLVR